MKKSIILVFALAAALCAEAQYQLPNGGFEQWDGNALDAEPSHWNSFATSDGSYASLASSPHHYRRNGGRPGSDGSKYLTIYTKSIIGVKANGNMTTGRIHAGSMSATGSDNYNYTQRSNADHCQPFSGTPDSMYLWVSFYASSASSQAQVAAVIHGNTDFRSPNHEGDASLYCGKAVARFSRTTSSAGSMHWQQLKVPFVYDGSSSANYLLVNMTTNYTPGDGAANDSLSIDDIVFIYSAWLNALTVGGVPVEGFDKGVMNYSLHVDNLDVDVNAVAEVADAAVTIGREAVNDTTVLVTVDVVAEDNVTMHRYTLTLTTGTPAVGINPVAPASLQLYPNPTANAVAVHASGEVVLCDLSGRIIMKHISLGQTTFDLSKLPAGTYVVRCGGVSARVVKQ